MTSRRSRLKAVTNLPVRKKVLAVQGNTSDNSSVDNLTTEKIVPSHPKSDEVLTTAYNSHVNHIAEKNIYDSSSKNKGNDSFPVVNCSVSQKNQNYSNESDSSKSKEPNNPEILENNSDLTKTCNLLSCKADSNSSPIFKNGHHYTLSSDSSSLGEKPLLQTFESRKENEILLQENCILNYNNNNNNSFNNNIVEDGFKCYTVLTPQSASLDSLTEYTITSLTSCENNYIDGTVTEVSATQEFEEVQIYTEEGSTELYINNEMVDNSESLIETEHLEPILTSLTNYNSENEVNCLNSDITELRNNSESAVVRPEKKNSSCETVLNENNEQQRGSFMQTKDSNVLKRTLSSASQKASPDFQSFKQISTPRRKRVKYSDYTKKLADAKREFQRKYEKSKPDRSSLKMIDLIFYNPSSNPMESKCKFEKKDTYEPSSEVLNDLLAEEKVDEPEILDSNSTSNMSDNNESESTNKMPVPQVKIGLDGEIILDEKSLIIETTEAKKGRKELQNSVPILEDVGCKVSYYRGKNKKTRDWADFETKRFYKALNTIGPDFTLMQKYFPKRSRLELKNKFKREERLNRALIDKALNNPSEFDMTQLEKDLAVEEEAEEGVRMRFCGIVKRAGKKPKVKSSLLSREIIESDGDRLESVHLNPKRSSETERNKKEKEFDFVLHKLLMKESGNPSSLNAIIGSDNEVT